MSSIPAYSMPCRLPAAVSKVFGPTYRFMTAGFLPAKIRTEMRLPWGERQQQAFDLLIKSVATLNRPVPRILRQLPVKVLWWDFQRRLRAGQPLV